MSEQLITCYNEDLCICSSGKDDENDEEDYICANKYCCLKVSNPLMMLDVEKALDNNLIKNYTKNDPHCDFLVIKSNNQVNLIEFKCSKYEERIIKGILFQLIYFWQRVKDIMGFDFSQVEFKFLIVVPPEYYTDVKDIVDNFKRKPYEYIKKYASSLQERDPKINEFISNKKLIKEIVIPIPCNLLSKVVQKT
ncbi:hypothetical protein DFR86_00850 [Acidianus sulfidivorans JP7]|uniref:Uncharacterized protein n=1 Tax=Acidianus sulfidivorans JP7 TaxID=619593 RepID=A0A2U9IJM7_9CREN|nr:hypothetical protein [Acidianus sulfidivorans]AWR96233.1 hypothetical protein DFR86_00850 [Acidianus sulfidivorans JP7]